MFGRAYKNIFVFLCFWCISIIFNTDYLFAQEKEDLLLNLPFSTNVRLLQGWNYTVLINNSNYHGAIDYDCELGEDIYAASDGVAMSSYQVGQKSKAGYGNFVLIKHKNGYATLYGHLDKASEHIKKYPSEKKNSTNYSEWTPVKKGEYIGDCGTSGTDNVHLHFEVTTGKYAVGRVDSYDLYKTKEFYPPNKSYSSLGPLHIWESDPPQYVLLGGTNVENPIEKEKKGILGTVKEWFGVADEKNIEVQQEEMKREQEQNDFADLSFANKTLNIAAKPGEEIEVVVEAKNTGVAVWKKNEISLNVNGGAALNEKFRHTSWLTALRPAILATVDVAPGDSAVGTVTLQGLSTGVHTLELIAVEVGTWKQIGDEKISIHITVTEELEPTRVTSTTQTHSNNPLEGVVRGIKDFAGDVVDKVVDVFKKIPNIFSGGGGVRSPISSVKGIKERNDRVTILYPTSHFLLTNTEILRISGERSEDTIIDIHAVSSSVHYPTEKMWYADVMLIPGDNHIGISVAGGEEIQTYEVRFDADVPEKPMMHASVENTSTIKLSWNSEDSELNSVYYSVQKKVDTGEWEEILSNTTSTVYEFRSELFHEYVFRVYARDEAGNRSEWSDEVSVITDWEKEVVFNEIAWAGSSGVCPNHQWIELFNSSHIEQSLDGWYVEVTTSSTGFTIPLSGKIDAGGLYLIAHANIFHSSRVGTIVPSTIILPVGGAHVVLRDGEGNVQDEIEQSTGWFGGSVGTYPSTLERVSVDSPSFSARTWKSSGSVRYGNQSSTCGVVSGSPGMPNKGHAFFGNQTLGFYPKNSEGKIVLSKEGNPYLFSEFTITQGNTLVLEPGVVFVGTSPESRILVQGELELHGTEDEKVVITSRNDSGFVSSSPLFATLLLTGTPSPGDWQNIEVGDTGMVHAQNAIIRYGGNRYGVSTFCQGCGRSQVISNYGGKINLKNVEVGYGYETGTQGTIPNSLIYIDNGNIVLENVSLHHGKRALHATKNAEVFGESVILYDFDSADKVVFFEEKMPVVWENIQFKENSPSYAYNPMFVVSSSVTITPDKKFEFGTVIIDQEGELSVEEGDLYAEIIKVYGTLNVMGGELSSEIAGKSSISSTFSYILFTPGSTGNFEKVKIRGGGYFSNTSAYPFSSPRSYLMWIDGAVVSIINSELIDARRPGGMVLLRNGRVTIRDSEIGWNSVYNKQSTWKEYGIVSTGDSIIHVENTDFRKMDYAAYIQGGVFTYDRMEPENFVDLYAPELNQKNWLPKNLFPF